MITGVFTAAGLLGLALGLSILALTASGHSPFDSLTGGLIAVVLLGFAGLVLPFAFVARWSRGER
jgi:hypothetical protein